MKRFILLAVALTLIASPVFAEKKYVTKDFEVLNFTKVESSISCKILYTVGEPSFSVSADEKAVEHISNAVKDGKLTIDFDKGVFHNLDSMIVRISSPRLNQITVSGAVTFIAEKVKTDSLTVNVNGASKIIVDGIKADKAFVSANGAGSVKMDQVECGDLKVNINGAGGGQLTGVNCGSIDVAVNGAGGCDVEGHSSSANLAINGVGGIDIKKFTADKLTSAVNGIGKISYAD